MGCVTSSPWSGVLSRVGNEFCAKTAHYEGAGARFELRKMCRKLCDDTLKTQRGPTTGENTFKICRRGTGLKENGDGKGEIRFK